MAESVRLEKRGAVAVIVLDSPPVNALGAAVRKAAVDCLAQAEGDGGLKAIVLTGRGRCFSAGADIREFAKPPIDPHLRQLIDIVEGCPKPVVAAIHGTAVGGGMELALGCHYRVGDASARVGLPEIKLGLLPGAGGTQRLPRLIGVEPALNLILSGEYLPAEQARALGLLDAVIDGDLVGALVGVCDGFVGNRMLYAYTRQAGFLLEEGALAHQVDKVIYDFGFPMGPFAMGDLAGLDVGWRIRRHRAKTRPANQRYSSIADRICEMGRFGQKTGAGWYLYEAGSRIPKPDPKIEELIISASGELGIERREIGDREILQRCMYPLINEGAKILEEGIAIRSSDIDVVWIHGYGFPAYRGGPMFYADTIGPKAVYDAMSRLYDTHGEILKPAPLLKELARTGRRFGDPR